MIRRDIAAAHQGFPEWEVHQKGVETLGFSVVSPKGQEGGSNKALTVNDLLIKVYQLPFNMSEHPNFSTSAYPENLQISAPVCRTSQAHASA